MIGSLRGRLLVRSSTAELLVEVHGVGYSVQVTAATAADLGAVGSEVFVYIHHVVREDAEQLYGFATDDERRTFEALIGAHRIGPALALAILGVHRPDALRRVVAEDDVDALRMVPGVGAKTAVRLLVELKAKLDLPEADVPPGSTTESARVGGSVLHDVRSALAGLGYGSEEVRMVMAELPADGDPEELLRKALSLLVGGSAKSGSGGKRAPWGDGTEGRSGLKKPRT